MEPIKIEFLMGGNLRDGLKEAGNELEALIDKCAKLRRTITARSEYSTWSKQIEWLEELMGEYARKGDKNQELFIKYVIAQLKFRRLFTKGAQELYGDNPKLWNKKKIEAQSEWKRIEKLCKQQHIFTADKYNGGGNDQEIVKFRGLFNEVITLIDEMGKKSKGSKVEREKGKINKEYYIAYNRVQGIQAKVKQIVKKLTPEEEELFDTAYEAIEKYRDMRIAAIYAAERRVGLQHMADYIKEYGSYQERRLAIAEEYDRKISEAGDEWEKKRLEKEKSGAMSALEVEAIKQSVDWGSVFGDFGQLFKEQIGPTIEKLRKIATSEEFKRADIKEREALYELITKLETAGAHWDSDIFKKLGDDLTAYQEAMRNYIAAQDDERRAAEALASAKERLAAAEASGDAFATAAARRSVTVATNALAAAGEKTREFGAQVQDASGALQSSTAKMNNMFTGLVSGISGLKSGNLQGVGEALMGLDKLLNNGKVTSAVGGALAKGLSKLLGNSEIGKSVAAALGNSGLLGQIISAILSLLDILKDGVGVLVSGVIDTVLGAVSGIIKNMLNGKMYLQIGQSLIDGISGILDAVTFGGFTSWFDTSNAKEVRETIDKLSERNATLQTAIEDLTDEIKSGRGTKSVAAYSDAYRYQEEANANYHEMAQAQAGYHGAHHSWEYYFEGFSEEQIAKLSRQIGRAWDGDLWSLTPEEMKLLRSNVDMWERIRDAGKGGYGDRLVEKLDDYIAQAGKLEELTGQLYEGLTGISFDSMYDSFVDQLMDMEATAEDFADNVSEYFMRAMLSNKVGELYADKLEDWWKKFGEAMKDNELSEAERNALSEEYMDYVREAMKLRDALATATGYDKTQEAGSSQSGKAGSFAAMSQDQGTKLEGLFVSVQGHVSHIDTKVENVADKLAMAEGHLAKIEEHTGASAGLLDDIKTLMEVIKRDGLKTR